MTISYAPSGSFGYDWREPLVRQPPLRASFVIACVCAALAFVIPACAPRSDLEGRPCPCADGYRCCEPAGVCIAESATCAAAPITSAETVTRICAQPQGPALGPPRTAAALGRYLARRWFGCRVDPSAPPGALVAHEGIEFALDETWSFLRPTATGYERLSNHTIALR